MDALDIRILRAMEVRPYGHKAKDPDSLRPSHVARLIGTSHVTVRARIARMEEAGVIPGYQVYPNLRHLGREASAFLFRVPDEERKTRALQETESVDGIFEVHNFMGPEVCIDVVGATREEITRKLGLLRAYTGDPEPRPLYERVMPPVDRELTNLDWRLLKALRWRGRRPLGEVAEAVGVNVRTARRRYDRMARNGDFFVVPLLDLSRLQGVIPFFLNFHTAPPPPRETVAAALALFEERRIHTYYPVDSALGNVGLMVFATSAADMDEMRSRAASIPGVERVSTWVYRGWAERTEWMDDAIEGCIKATGQ